VGKARSSFVVVFLLASTLNSENMPASQLPSVQQESPQRRGIGEPPEPEVERMHKEQLKRANKARQQALKKDTDDLLKMATELKQYVDKTNENVLSLDVLRKAEAIEKLAKSVKDKMKAQ
jgi:hypothetical protein